MNRAHLSQLAVLATVAQCASFRGAARELGIAPSAVSHAVASLEARLGVRLLARSTRSVAPTEEGAQLLERLRPALSEIDLALETAVEARDRPAEPGDDILLSVITDGRHAAIDMRLVDPDNGNEPDNKLNDLVGNAWRIWSETADSTYVRPDGKVFELPGAAQMIFWAFAAVMGLSLANIFIIYTGASVARVFFTTGPSRRRVSRLRSATSCPISRGAM